MHRLGVGKRIDEKYTATTIYRQLCVWWMGKGRTEEV
jgi:hypothetical protein